MSTQGASLAPRRRRIPAPLRHGVTIFLALLVVEYLVIPRLVAAGKSLNLLARVDVVWLIVAMALETAALFAYALLSKVLLPPNSATIGTLFRIDLATTAIGHVLPGGTAGSATLGYRLITGLGVDGKAAGFAMATQGLGSAVVLNVLLWLSLVISIPFAGVHAIYAAVALVGMLAILAVAALVFLFTRGEQGAIRVVGAIGRRLPFVSEERIIDVVVHVGGSLRELWGNREQLRLAIVWAAANWLLDAACLWSFLAAFHRYVNPVELFAAYGIGNVLAVIPITPGGLGVVETFTALVLKSFGVPTNTATLAVIGWRLVNFWLPIPVGAGCYLSLRATRGSVAGTRREALSAMVREARSETEGDHQPDGGGPSDPAEQQDPVVRAMPEPPQSNDPEPTLLAEGSGSTDEGPRFGPPAPGSGGPEQGAPVEEEPKSSLVDRVLAPYRDGNRRLPGRSSWHKRPDEERRDR